MREVALVALSRDIAPSREVVSNTTMNKAREALGIAFASNSPGKLWDFVEAGGSRGHRGQNRQKSSFHKTKDAKTKK